MRSIKNLSFLIFTVLVLVRCTKNNEDIQPITDVSYTESLFQNDELQEQPATENLEMYLKNQTTDSLPEGGVESRSSIIAYNLSPYQGCPNKTTYKFAIKDNGGLPAMAVKLFSPLGQTYYVDMKRSGSSQVLNAVLSTPGRWAWRYVYKSNHKSYAGLSSQYKDNTAVQVNTSGTSKIHSPFSGSGWRLTCGQGCGLHTHSNGEYYAQDWANSTRAKTEDKPFYSPLDGVVVKVDYKASSYGNYVEIEQEVGTKTVKFRIAHLNDVEAYEGQPVTGGKTLIGRIGDTGGTSTAPHAHCSLFDVTSSQKSIPFSFTASCN